MSQRIITVHCDMDGVVVDMDRFIEENLSKAARRDDAIMWPELQAIPNVYRLMPPTPYARKLWQAVMATGMPRKMLTAIPRVTSVPTAEADKNWWVATHKERVFCGETPEVNVGPYSRDKWRHCMPGDVLIDDRADNCAAWETAGGYAIFHQGDVEATIRLLNAYIKSL
jgi:hypothetical protein